MSETEEVNGLIEAELHQSMNREREYRRKSSQAINKERFSQLKVRIF